MKSVVIGWNLGPPWHMIGHHWCSLTCCVVWQAEWQVRGGQRGQRGQGRAHGEAVHASLVHPAVMVQQNAGVESAVRRLQVRDGEREVSPVESVRRHVHPAVEEVGSVLALLPGGVQVHEPVGPFPAHARRLPVPARHLLLRLPAGVRPHRAPVHTRQNHRAALQHHEHRLLPVPEPLLFTGCGREGGVSVGYRGAAQMCLQICVEDGEYSRRTMLSIIK